MKTGLSLLGKHRDGFAVHTNWCFQGDGTVQLFGTKGQWDKLTTGRAWGVCQNLGQVMGRDNHHFSAQFQNGTIFCITNLWHLNQFYQNFTPSHLRFFVIFQKENQVNDRQKKTRQYENKLQTHEDSCCNIFKVSNQATFPACFLIPIFFPIWIVLIY